MPFSRSHEHLQQKDELLSSELSQLLNFFRRKKALLHTVKALVTQYPSPAHQSQLVEFISSQLDNNLIELRISRIRALLQKYGFNYEVVRIKDFGYQLIKNDSESTIPWWAKISLIDRKILLALLENPLTSEDIISLLKEYGPDSSPSNKIAIHSRMSRLRAHIETVQLGTIPDVQETPDSSYTLVLNSTLDKQKIRADLEFSCQVAHS